MCIFTMHITTLTFREGKLQYNSLNYEDGRGWGVEGLPLRKLKEK